ncbi:unnamed protein product, partial [Didymodactylos carnosus]
DKFGLVRGSVRLANDGRMAIHEGTSLSTAEIRGQRLYNSGIHRIEMKIEAMTKDNVWVYIGIISSTTPIETILAYKSSSSYGWVLGTDQIYAKGRQQVDFSNVGHFFGSNVNDDTQWYDSGSFKWYNYCSADYQGPWVTDSCGRRWGWENNCSCIDRSVPSGMPANVATIELIIDCNNKKIILINKRTYKQAELTIDTAYCMFSWQLSVALCANGDRISVI